MIVVCGLCSWVSADAALFEGYRAREEHAAHVRSAHPEHYRARVKAAIRRAENTRKKTAERLRELRRLDAELNGRAHRCMT